MPLDQQFKFGFTTKITLDDTTFEAGPYGPVVSIPISNVRAVPSGEVFSSYGPVVSMPVSNVDSTGVYGQTLPTPLSRVGSMGVYGQVMPTPLSSARQEVVYGQVMPVSLAALTATVVYGQVVAISGFGPITLTSTIPGVGDIIYYGDVADINLDGGNFAAAFDNQVIISGMAIPVSNQNSLSAQSSNSIIFASSGVSVLPTPDVGVYFFFSNHNGASLSVSGVEPIATSMGEANLVSVSGVGSHLGLIGAGSKWIAIEESGVI